MASWCHDMLHTIKRPLKPHGLSILDFAPHHSKPKDTTHLALIHSHQAPCCRRASIFPPMDSLPPALVHGTTTWPLGPSLLIWIHQMRSFRAERGWNQRLESCTGFLNQSNTGRNTCNLHQGANLLITPLQLTPGYCQASTILEFCCPYLL